MLTREVQNLEPIEGGWCVELDGGERVSARSVILATGVDWRRLEAEGIEPLMGRGVLYGASRTEAGTVVGKDIFIVGGGNSAGQAAMYFSGYANSVTMLVRGSGLKLTMSQYLIDQIQSRPNITVEPFTRVVACAGEHELETICTVTGDEPARKRHADGLFVMIGANAQTTWLPEKLQRSINNTFSPSDAPCTKPQVPRDLRPLPQRRTRLRADASGSPTLRQLSSP